MKLLNNWFSQLLKTERGTQACNNKTQTELKTKSTSFASLRSGPVAYQAIKLDEKANEPPPAQSLKEKSENNAYGPTLSKFIKKSENATCQCYPKIFVSKYLGLQLAWSLLFVALTGATAYFVYNNVSEYLEYKVVSQIEVIHEKTPEFPAVTVCDSNIFATKHAENLIASIAMQTYGIDLSSNLTVYTQETLDKLNKVILLAKLNVTSKEYPIKERAKLGFDLRQIVSFTYDNGFYSTRADLLESFRWVFDFDYGSCFQFNSGFRANQSQTDVRRVEVQGPNYGLKLFINDLEYKNRLPTAESNGIKVFIHNRIFMAR